MWKRWRNCWQYWMDGKKVGAVVFSRAWKGGSLIHSYARGHRILPLGLECGEEGSFPTFYRAKQAVELEISGS